MGSRTPAGESNGAGAKHFLIPNRICSWMKNCYVFDEWIISNVKMILHKI